MPCWTKKCVTPKNANSNLLADAVQPLKPERTGRERRYIASAKRLARS
jgi:hypothetical protein